MTAIARRTLLVLPAAAAAPAVAQRAPAESFAEAERAILAGRAPVAGGIAIDIPPLSENGNSVDVSIRVDSPMTEADHVTAIHILSERNPYPRVASFTLSRRAGRAEVATRIRLATTQSILVLAETSTGRVHRDAREVIVILGACVDGG
jgi:sulfur-oxidizing protein SoxY